MTNAEDYIFKMVSENNEYYKIAMYIMEKHPDIYTLKEAKDLAKYLTMEKKYSISDILAGKSDLDIAKHVELKLIKMNSVLRKDEIRKETPLQTLKHKIKLPEYRKIIVTIVGVTAIGAITVTLTSSLEDVNLTQNVNDNIAMLASNYGSSDYINKRDIVSQNTYRLEYNEETNTASYAYHNDLIASDIVKVCTKNPELFDVCMYHTYFNMNANALSNMDEVLRYLKVYLQNDAAFTSIYDKIKDCNSFLDYIVLRGFINPNDKDYYLLLEDIKTYNTSGDFNTLNPDSQKRIKNLIGIYEDNKTVLYNAYKDVLENLVQDEQKR